MNAPQRNLAWKLNWWRQSELDGALLLGRMVGAMDNQYLTERLTRHCAEEAAHSQIWSGVINQLGLPHVRIFRSYQSFYLRHSGPPGSLVEVLAFTQVFERRVHTRFHEESNRAGTPQPAITAYRKMMEDEKDHLEWVAAWLRKNPAAPGLLERYRKIDAAVFAELQPYADRLWDIPDLGLEPHPVAIP